MTPPKAGPLTQAWYRWKALRLPWRKRFLVGHDLQGNTYWEFRLTRNPGERWRRIVQYPASTHYSQVKVSPLWHQWLRYTRDHPPGIKEQEGDLVRQARMKVLAAEADARWEAKPRVMEDVGKPGTAQLGQPVPPLQSKSMGTQEQDSHARTVDQAGTAEAEDAKNAKDPWAQAKAQGPGERWQPESWSPPTKNKKP